MMPVPTLEQINDYETTPARVGAAIEGLSETQMLYSPKYDEWCIHEIVLHLPDSETFAYERMRRTIAEEKPLLQVYPEAMWAQKLFYQKQDYRLALNLFTLQRQATGALLRALPPKVWERTGVHSENGEMDLYALFITYLNHGNTHLAQIEQRKQQW
jgi:hypothetical protein